MSYLERRRLVFNGAVAAALLIQGDACGLNLACPFQRLGWMFIAYTLIAGHCPDVDLVCLTGQVFADFRAQFFAFWRLILRLDHLRSGGGLVGAAGDVLLEDVVAIEGLLAFVALVRSKI